MAESEAQQSRAGIRTTVRSAGRRHCVISSLLSSLTFLLLVVHTWRPVVGPFWRSSPITTQPTKTATGSCSGGDVSEADSAHCAVSVDYSFYVTFGADVEEARDNEWEADETKSTEGDETVVSDINKDKCGNGSSCSINVSSSHSSVDKSSIINATVVVNGTNDVINKTPPLAGDSIDDDDIVVTHRAVMDTEEMSKLGYRFVIGGRTVVAYKQKGNWRSPSSLVSTDQGVLKCAITSRENIIFLPGFKTVMERLIIIEALANLRQAHDFDIVGIDFTVRSLYTNPKSDS